MGTTKWLLLSCFAVLFVGGGALLFAQMRPHACLIAFSPPKFKPIWNEEKHPGWKVVEEYDDFEAHYIFHSPKGEEAYIAPEFETEFRQDGPIWHRDGYVSAYLPLKWDGKSLDLEPGTKDADSSWNRAWFDALYVRSTFQRISPRIFCWSYRIRLYPNSDSGNEYAERTVVVTVEMRPAE